MSARSTILLIDDDPAVLLTVGDRLRAEGHSVIDAASGQEALRTMATSPVDLVVLDIGMPDMSGLGFLKEASSDPRYRNIPVLVFTARINMENFFQNMGTAGFVPKTANPELLLSTITDILRRQRGARDVSPSAVTRKVLIVEDDKDSQHHLARLFKSKGITPHIVEDPTEVVSAATTHEPDAIVLKYVLTNGSGPFIARLLHESPSTRSIPVILYDDSGLHQEVNTANIVKFLSAPRDEDFLRVVSRYIGSN